MRKLVYMYMFFGLGIIVLIVFWLFIYNVRFWFTPTDEQITLMDTNEPYILEDLPVLGGDGARVWNIYKAQPKTLVGQMQSGEGFNPDNSMPLEVFEPEDQTILMYYLSKNHQLISAMNDCVLDDNTSEIISNTALGFRARFPKGALSTQMAEYATSTPPSWVMSGNFAWCTAVPLDHQIYLERINSFHSLKQGEIRTPDDMTKYLTNRHLEWELAEQASSSIFLVMNRIHGTSSGPYELEAWFMQPGKSIFHVRFGRYLNKNNIKTFFRNFTVL